MTATQEEAFEVAIVGYGPVGATLGHLLGLCGVNTLILEREDAIYRLPRAVHFDDEVMRTFQAIGLADALSPLVRINPGMRFVDTAGKLLLDWPRAGEVGRHGWHASYRFHQPDLERVLRDAMAGRSSVTVRTHCEASLIEDRDTHVRLRYEDMRTGRAHSVCANYIVGCDGARSFVRGLIETEMEDYGFHERWLVIDALLKRDKPELGDYSIQYCNPARPATYVRGPANRRRWEITVLPGEDSTQIASAPAVWKLLAPWLKPEEAELERAVVYTFHSLIAQDWRRGRLLLAGDAAHQTPPFMGQGMCAGIRDVANLAWKLALVVRGRVMDADTLLNTYQSERYPNAREYITTAVRLGGLINTCAGEQALHSAFPRPDGSARMESIAPPLGPGISRGEHAGRLFGQPRMTDGRLMDTVTGYAPVLVADAALARGIRPPGGLALVTTGEAPGACVELRRFGVGVALLRPDRYIHGTANDHAGLAALVATAFPSPLSQPTNGPNQ